MAILHFYVITNSYEVVLTCLLLLKKQYLHFLHFHWPMIF